MIERKLIGRVDKNRQRPRFFRSTMQLDEGSFDIARGNQDNAFQTARKSRAVIRHPAVIGLIHGRFERNVFNRRPTTEPAGRQHEIHIDAFQIHIINTHTWITLTKWIRLTMLVAFVAAHVLLALWLFIASEA